MCSQHLDRSCSLVFAALIEEHTLHEDTVRGDPGLQGAGGALAGSEPLPQNAAEPYSHMAPPAHVEGQSADPDQGSAAGAAAEDGWDFEDSALDGLGDAQPAQSGSAAQSKEGLGVSSEQPAASALLSGETAKPSACVPDGRSYRAVEYPLSHITTDPMAGSDHSKNRSGKARYRFVDI